MTSPNSPFFTVQGIDRLDLGELAPGHWVEIKSILTLRDQDELGAEQLSLEIPQITKQQRKGFRNNPELQQELMPRNVKYNPARVPILVIAIVGWSFIDIDTGMAIPLTRSNIELLDREIADFIHDEIDTRNPV